ncbi:MAG: hypothetical protein OIN66_05650 [Candidatus Methanoperedens sp.]|nr:hypothetical protein [Candidatus Methanoperedens sp.]
MIDLAQYGSEDSLGLHVFLSNLFWLVSIILATIAYRYRRLWNVGDTPWTFLFLTFIFFWIRELGHFSGSPLIASVRYIFGTLSAIFMSSTFILLCSRICRRKKDSKLVIYMPFIVGTIFPAIMLYLYYTGVEINSIKKTMGLIESIVWIVAASSIIYTTYMLGMHATGGFTSVFMFFQFSAFAAFTWKLLGLIEIMGSPIPYSIRESVETLFGLFAIVSMYLLTGMLRKLSKHIYSE